jgi:hypothetical protein
MCHPSPFFVAASLHCPGSTTRNVIRTFPPGLSSSCAIASRDFHVAPLGQAGAEGVEEPPEHGVGRGGHSQEADSVELAARLGGGEGRTEETPATLEMKTRRPITRGRIPLSA